MALLHVLAVGCTLLTVGPSVLGTSLTEQGCVVHPLSPEVVQQLLAGTNATMKHLQEIKSLLITSPGSGDRLDVPETPNVLQHHVSVELLSLLLTKLDKEQARYTQELEMVKEEIKAMKRGNIGGTIRPQEPLSGQVGTTPQAAFPLDDTCYPSSARPRDCHDLLQAGKDQSGPYNIFPHSCGRREEPVRAWCEQGDGGGGWTVVLIRRPLDEQINFNRGWRDYRNGFGEPETEYWIGNEVLHELTSRRPQVLRVELEDWDGEARWAEYWAFLVEDEDSLYRVHLGQYSGTAGDAFKSHDNMFFSTYDRDHDKHSSTQCAVDYHGGFWYNRCHTVSPTSLLLSKQKSTVGLTWNTWYSDRTTLRNVTFKLRPKPCS